MPSQSKPHHPLSRHAPSDRSRRAGYRFRRRSAARASQTGVERLYAVNGRTRTDSVRHCGVIANPLHAWSCLRGCDH
jgi:hypothetical protein